MGLKCIRKNSNVLSQLIDLTNRNAPPVEIINIDSLSLFSIFVATLDDADGTPEQCQRRGAAIHEQ